MARWTLTSMSLSIYQVELFYKPSNVNHLHTTRQVEYNSCFKGLRNSFWRVTSVTFLTPFVTSSPCHSGTSSSLSLVCFLYHCGYFARRCNHFITWFVIINCWHLLSPIVYHRPLPHVEVYKLLSHLSRYFSCMVLKTVGLRVL